MKTIVSFRTSVENKIKLMEKAEKLGISISDLLDTLLIDDLNNISKTKVSEESKWIIKRGSIIVRIDPAISNAYRISKQVKEKIKRLNITMPEHDELVGMLKEATQELKESREECTELRR